MSERNLTLLTDLYELTMMQGYFKEEEKNVMSSLICSTAEILTATALRSAAA